MVEKSNSALIYMFKVETGMICSGSNIWLSEIKYQGHIERLLQ